MIMILKQREIKFEPRIKLNHNTYIGSPSSVCTCYNQVKLKIQLKIFSHRLIPLSPSPNSWEIVIIHELGLGDKQKEESV